MNHNLMIRELNREIVPLNQLKKNLLIEDDNLLIKELLFILNKSIKSLKSTSILADFKHIFNILYYLNLYDRKEIDVNLEHINYVVQQKIKNTNSKYYRYYQFLNTISNHLQKRKVNLKSKKETPNSILKDDQDIFLFLRHLEDYIDHLEDYIDFLSISKIIEKIMKFVTESKQLDQIKEKLENLLELIKTKLKHNEDIKNKAYLSSLQDRIRNILYKISYYQKYEKLKLYKEYLKEYQSVKESIVIPQIILNQKTDPSPYIITIDKKYAKDLDDAVSITKNNYGITIHVYISDVRNYYTNQINETALYRGSSIYLKDHTYHMLPGMIAKNYGSLIEKQPRKTIHYSFYIDSKDHISYQVESTVISVSERLSYYEVNHILEEGCENSKKEETIHLLYETLNRILKQLKYSFLRDQKKIEKSNQIVEIYSVLTNHFVANDCMLHNYPLLYRNYTHQNEYYSLKNYEKNPYCRITSPIRKYSDSINERLYGLFKFNKDIDDDIYHIVEEQINHLIPTIVKTELLNQDIEKIMRQEQKILKVVKR